MAPRIPPMNTASDAYAGMRVQRHTLNRRFFHVLKPPRWRRTGQRDWISQCLPSMVTVAVPERRDTAPTAHEGFHSTRSLAAAVAYSQSECQLPAGGNHRRWDIVGNDSPARRNPSDLA